MGLMTMRCLFAGPRNLTLPVLPSAYQTSHGYRRNFDRIVARQSKKQPAKATDGLVSEQEDEFMNSYAEVLGDVSSRYRVLVLDSSYRPIEIINWKRAICLDLFNKVDVLEYYDYFVRSAYQEHFIPAVLRVRMYIKGLSKQNVTVSRRNVILRDRHTCQYCGVKSKFLTIDHVVPKQKGGLWEWENLVAACSDCNAKKGSMSLKQLRWTLQRPPRAPSAYELGMSLGSDLNMASAPKEWISYLYHL